MAIVIRNKDKLLKGGVTLLAASQPAAIMANALDVEDEFSPYYNTSGGGASGHILRPPYDPRQLEKLCGENNALGPCIDAMVVNIDGTGHKIELKAKDPDVDADEKEDPIAIKLEAFFDEPYPGVSFMTMRRDLRRDLERTGNAYLEVMRNYTGDVVFVRPVAARTIRMIKLDGAVNAKKTVVRNGVSTTFNVLIRERRYVQMMSGQLLYFREFGSTRDLDKRKGSWSTQQAVSAAMRATELIHFQVGQDPNSPYGVPRWDGQIPSVLGSRKAEETNLDYLRSGALPPVMIMVQGGYMAEATKKAIEQQFSPGAKHRAAIVEVASSGGSLEDKGTGVKVSVEKFGSENIKDSMFEKYDTNCFLRVLHAFRLPEMFVGQSSQGRTFAVAYANYITAEAQVFGPERQHFDEVITRKLLPALGGSAYKFVSKPITIKDANTQVAGLTLAAGIPGADPESIIDAINETTDLKVMYSQDLVDQAREDAQSPPMMAVDPTTGKPPPPKPMFGAGNKPPFGAKGGDKTTKPGATKPAASGALPSTKKPTTAAVGKTPRGTPRKVMTGKADIAGAMELADRVMVAMRTRKSEDEVHLRAQADQLTEAEQAIFRRALAVRQYLDPSADPEGLGEIAACTAAVMANNDSKET